MTKASGFDYVRRTSRTVNLAYDRNDKNGAESMAGSIKPTAYTTVVLASPCCEYRLAIVTLLTESIIHPIIA